jgi:predicted Rossmann-fold nucleotide-binding protein
MLEIDSLSAFDAHVADHGSLADVAIQGLDLCYRTQVLLHSSVEGAVFLGCIVEPEAQRRLIRDAVVFPRFPDLPFRAFRGELYDAEELFGDYVPGDHVTFESAFDTRVYRWFKETQERHNVVELLAQRVHDHAIEDALSHAVAGRTDSVVAIMGGHGMRRDGSDYRDVASLARALTRAGKLCASGGGPGAMEATNLGAWLASHDDDALDEALAVLAEAPGFEPVPAWLDAAFEVRRRWPLAPGTVNSLGIPTWHYGHEPPNVFASHVAKYFANSIREDGLLAIALGGVVFAPGSAGTIQEVFQDAAQNHYQSFGVPSPMVFLDVDYWTKAKPVCPLLRALAEGHDYARMLHIEDDVDAVLAHLVS